MLLQNKKIAIVGGGPGGLTLAKLLQDKGVNVKIYERDFDRTARVQGSPLDLHQESGLAALQQAGLMEVFKKNYMRGADREQIMDPQGTVFFSDHGVKKEENFGDPHFRPEIDRGVLRNLLLDTLQPGTIHWNCHFTEMKPQNDGWILYFKDGNTAYADIVIAADGAHSKIRPYLTDIKAFYSGITMIEGNIPNASEKSPAVTQLLKGGKIMAFGTTENILMGQKGNDEIGFYLSFKVDENWTQQNTVDFNAPQQVKNWYKTKYASWNPLWDELLEVVTYPLTPRPIYCMPLDQHWVAQPNLTLIGDSAHVMPPFAGEGVNMAMLDALELCNNLTGNIFKAPLEAIADYESRMRQRASLIAKESLDNGETMHNKHALRDMLAFFTGFENP
ncbi:FAD-dependent oxidoreductase [Sphingobacterium psychroaquaticum]|uniref:Flavin-dependent monooxygenase n=1 Tax=Sphingobacterium psychroaquaticum TaxID=561061 RepID=A0A1X7JPY3_9SPHI|nr:NAD(P)/FAD-dependent oxidoreductase [Sphingobacterium psychroaquaticum]SMG30082.1 2-polyprenyl-6-methoxyphenol hydroxylase [Sphingobacterium psychroaquaticum]